MLFSVIVPTHNRRELLEVALDSVCRQTFTDYEVIVVDDGSTDATAEWLKTDGRKLRVLRQDRRGPSAARNAGAAEAAGEYIAFLDSDDFWFPWILENYAAALRKHGRTALLCANRLEFAGEAPHVPAVP